MNYQLTAALIRSKLIKGDDFTPADKQFVQRFTPQNGIMIKTYIYPDYSIESKKQGFVHIFLSEQDSIDFFLELQHSTYMQWVVAKYFAGIYKNLLFTRTKKNTLKQILRYIDLRTKVKPIISMTYDLEQGSLKEALNNQLTLDIQWEPEISKKQAIFEHVPDRMIDMPQSNKTKKEVKVIKKSDNIEEPRKIIKLD